MEIPVVNRISDLQLPDPSCLSRTLSISGIGEVAQAYHIWKWGALILLAVLASFGTLFTRVNVFVVGLRRRRDSSSETNAQHDDFSDIDDYSDNEDDHCSISSASDSSDDELESDSEEPHDHNVRGSSSGLYGGDRGQNRNSMLRRRKSFGGLGLNRFSWSDFAAGKSVVNLWDTSSSPATYLSADAGSSSVGIWDARVGCNIPAILAEWGPQIGRIVGVGSGGVGKVYVKDGVTGALAVGDVRNVAAPLGNVTEADVDDTWWDADAVSVTDDRFDGSAVSGCDSAVTRCCSAVRSYLL